MSRLAHSLTQRASLASCRLLLGPVFARQLLPSLAPLAGCEFCMRFVMATPLLITSRPSSRGECKSSLLTRRAAGRLAGFPLIESPARGHSKRRNRKWRRRESSDSICSCVHSVGRRLGARSPSGNVINARPSATRSAIEMNDDIVPLTYDSKANAHSIDQEKRHSAGVAHSTCCCLRRVEEAQWRRWLLSRPLIIFVGFGRPLFCRSARSSSSAARVGRPFANEAGWPASMQMSAILAHLAAPHSPNRVHAGCGLATSRPTFIVLRRARLCAVSGRRGIGFRVQLKPQRRTRTRRSSRAMRTGELAADSS